MLDPTLRLLYDFKNQHNLNSKFGLGPTLGFTRTQDGFSTYFESSRIMRYAQADEPRFDHDPTTGEPLGLLCEDARTNICLHSQDLSGGSSWTNQRTVDAQNQGVAADGSNSLNKITDDGTNGVADDCSVFQAVTLGLSTTYVFYADLKADQLDWARIGVVNLGALAISAYFDLTNGVVGATTGADNTSEFIIELPNGLYRCGIVFDSDAADTTAIFYIGIAEADNDDVVDRDGTSSIFVGDVQIEAGIAPTSVIPTTTTSQDRGLDVPLTTDMSWYNEAEGTVVVSCSVPDIAGGGQPFSISDNSTSDRFYNVRSGIAGTNYIVVAASASVASLTSLNGWAAAVQSHIVYSYKLNDFELFCDGTRAGTGDQLGAVPTGMSHAYVGVGYNGADSPWRGHIQEIRFYGVRKVNQTLEDLSNGLIPYGYPQFVVSSKISATGRNAAAIPPNTFVSGM